MKVQSEKGLSLKLGGANFLKPQAKELLTDDDEDDDNLTSEPPKIVSSEPTKVRSILKGSSSPLTKKSANFSQDQVEPKKNLKAEEVIRDESRRIQFDIQAEKKALVMDDEPTETSSESVAIDDINVKKDFMGKWDNFFVCFLLLCLVRNCIDFSTAALLFFLAYPLYFLQRSTVCLILLNYLPLQLKTLLKFQMMMKTVRKIQV